MLAPHISVEIVGLPELIKELERIDRDLKGDRLLERWERAVELIGNVAREKAPEWRGYLRASIEEEAHLEGEDMVGIVYSDEFYAPFQERGTDPYWPNLSAIAAWCDDHDVSPLRVAQTISERGLIGQKYFEESVTENVEDVYRLIGDGVAEIMEREY